jgi:glycosyltransferase involved in cell wall biosynthesis
LKKIAIVSSHPIQYNAPLFALLAKERKIDLKVFYTWGEDAIKEKFDPDFQQNIKWDIPLLEGYNYQFLNNSSKDPGSHHFKGIINADLNEEIEIWGADVVWVWGWSFDSHLKALRYFKGKKEVWFRGDSTLLDEPKGLSLMKMLRRVFLTWVYLKVDKAFYVGTNNKAYFIKHGLKEYQLVYAPHAIDKMRFTVPTIAESSNASEWREKLNLKVTDTIIMFAGKFEQKKNPNFLIKISKAIPSNTFKFLMVGNGKLIGKLKDETKSDSRFVYLDFQNQSKMPDLYRLANYFVLPSLGPGETWGLSINEALSSGTPVIASVFCGGAIDLINSGNGMIFHPEYDLPKVIKYITQVKPTPTNFSKKKSLLNGHSYDEIIQSVNKAIDEVQILN